MVQIETNIKVKIAGQNYILHVLKLLSLTKPNKVYQLIKNCMT